MWVSFNNRVKNNAFIPLLMMMGKLTASRHCTGEMCPASSKKSICIEVNTWSPCLQILWPSPSQLMLMTGLPGLLPSSSLCLCYMYGRPARFLSKESSRQCDSLSKGLRTSLVSFVPSSASLYIFVNWKVGTGEDFKCLPTNCFFAFLFMWGDTLTPYCSRGPVWRAPRKRLCGPLCDVWSLQ